VSFNVSADDYLSFMARYSGPLAVRFADLAGVTSGQRALDVGCGPGTLTAELVSRLGPGAVCAVEPSGSFAKAARQRLPGAGISQAVAEQLPLRDESVDVALAQLVVHFMTDPVTGLREMGRVTRRGGTVGACVWDHGGDRGPLSVFWPAARDLDPAVTDESGLAGVREGHLPALMSAAGLGRVRAGSLTVHATFGDFEQWWRPFTLGVGPAGAYTTSLPAEHAAALRERCRELLPPGPVEVAAVAWAAVGEP
jgi:SAM-dependent methyltransferase